MPHPASPDPQTSAIIAGLISTALGVGVGGAQRSAIAVTVIGGQSLCLFRTLVVVPMANVKFDALEQTVLSQREKVGCGSSPRTPSCTVRPAAAAK